MGTSNQANQQFLETAKPDALLFHKGLNQSRAIQNQLLLKILKENAQTTLGQELDFSAIKTVPHFQKQVPLLEDWQTIQNSIEKMLAGEANILFQGVPLFFEETSGSKSVAKRIPYNNALLGGFQRAINTWFDDLHHQNPKIFTGTAYWSLSPPQKSKTISLGGIPIGAPSDAAYFTPHQQRLLKEILVAPDFLSAQGDAKTFYTATWVALLRAKMLTFFSVWSPMFLIRLQNFLIENKNAILEALKKTEPARQKLLNAAAQDFSWAILFPHLEMVSCWDQGQASVWIPQLKTIIGAVPFQGKGLLATEGVTTIPIGRHHLLAYQSHFYEFRDVASGEILLSHQLQRTKQYEVLLTTQGGLFRYATKDIVVCTAFIGDTPSLQFLGRGQDTSDLVGEKLSLWQLSHDFQDLQQKLGIQTQGIYLVRYTHPKPGYKLFVSGVAAPAAQELTTAYEKILNQNPYYQQAVRMEQLTGLTYLITANDFTEQLYQHYQRKMKIADGDLKLPLFYTAEFLMPIIN